MTPPNCIENHREIWKAINRRLPRSTVTISLWIAGVLIAIFSSLVGIAYVKAEEAMAMNHAQDVRIERIDGDLRYIREKVDAIHREIKK